MEEGCKHDCENCKEKCSEAIEKEKLNEFSKVKKVIGIVSGKGGVGKSIITSMLAVLSKRKGLNTAIIDADITGPSIPGMFGISDRLDADENNFIIPAKSQSGIEVVSTNLLLDDPTKPVIWRGPIIADMVRQYWTSVIWKDIDVMFVDMPPGTGDVPLIAFQSLPLDGIVIVTSPQELVGMVVSKAINMANMMNIPIVGIVENMSYYKCGECGNEEKIFGESHVEKIANDYKIENVFKIPLSPQLAKACDNGNIEAFEGEWLNKLEELLEKIK